MKTALIITGGEYSSLPDSLQYDYVIACDKGYEYAVRLGITPDIILGDFDSCELDVSTFPVKSQVLTYPVRKDDTDLMLAIKQAILDGYTHLIIACALGGRLDHTYANIQSMVYASEHGCKCELITSTEHLLILKDDSITLPKQDDTSLSVFSITDVSEGVTITGASYDVADIKLTNTFPLGLGNSWASDNVTISVENGTLLIVRSSML